MEKSLFTDFGSFLKMKSQKSAILVCAAILKDFQKKYLVLQNVEEFSKNLYFLILGVKKKIFDPP
jgi:hypothetical protein